MNRFIWLATHLPEAEDQIRLVERRGRRARELLQEALLRAAEETLRARGLTFG